MNPIAELFRVAARLRGARAFHPRGAVFSAIWHAAADPGPLRGSPLLDGDHPAYLRLSHGIGLPPGVPDILGWAIKVLDVHGPGHDQDLLLASTGDGAVGRHLLRPARDLATTTHSSLLRYAVAGAGRSTVVARGTPGSDPLPYAEVARPDAALPHYEVRLGGVDGPLLATVEVGGRAPERVAAALRFDPWHTGPELRPVGMLNALRAPTYTASQDGRGAPAAGRFDASVP